MISTLENMVFQKLKLIIPKPLSEFPKLKETDNNPYIFDRWDLDLNKNYIMYYKFPSKDGKKINKKRVFINDLETLLNTLNQRGITLITREKFSIYCPKTNKDGTCGYAVSIRIFEYLKLGYYLGAQGFQIN